ncbi:MAG: PEP-CTERM sorting domain-containing protein [Phycisphaerae bacterium]|jgi:hypothetical protein
MSRYLLMGAALAVCASTGLAAEVWKANFDSDADGVVDIYDNNPNKAMIGPASGGKLEIVSHDTYFPHAGESFAPTTDRAGRPLGVAVNGHNEFSALYTFNWSSLNETTTERWHFAGFLGSPATNPGTSRGGWIGALLRSSKTAGGDYRLRVGAQWGTAYGQDRNAFAPQITLASGGANPYNTTYQLAISYQGDYLGDTGRMYLQVDLYNASEGKLIASTAGLANLDNIDGLLPWGTDPAAKEAALTACLPTHLGWSDYNAHGVASGGSIPAAVWQVHSLAFYDTFDGALNAVPEPASLLLCAAGAAALFRRRR